MQGRRYLLALLAVTLAFSFVDRTALGLALQNIKADLALTDTELGLLTGIAFALFYSIMGVPIARWADRGDRVRIISVTTLLWSIAVMICGVAGSFLQLLLVRVVVAVGEAGCLPPAQSLIADHFTRAERPRAMGIYSMGGPLAGVVGFFVAGWLNEIYGWRMMFLLLGAPGVILALLVWRTLEEPRRVQPARSITAANRPSMRQVVGILWSHPSFRNLMLLFGVCSFFGWGVAQWLPTFFIRSFGLSTGEIGSWLALLSGISGFSGTFLGGSWASRYARNNEALQLGAVGLVVTAAGVLSVAVYLAPSAPWAFVFFGAHLFALSTINGPILGTIQTLVPDSMRATALAFIYLFSNLIGLGLGPLAAGVLSDVLRPLVGEESLRYALLAMSPGFAWCAWYAWRASKTVMSDVERSRISACQA